MDPIMSYDQLCTNMWASLQSYFICPETVKHEMPTKVGGLIEGLVYSMIFFTILISTSGEGVLILTNIRPRIDGHWMASQIDLLKSGFQQVWFYLEFNALHLKLSESNNYFQFTLDFKLYTGIWFLEICIFRWSGNWLLAELSLNWKHL